MIITENQIEALAEIEREACKDSFFDFFLSFWSTISEEKLVVNWHMPYLCGELQKLAPYIIERRSKPYDMLVNIPPGTTKSSICTVMFPVWLWVQDPSIKIITNSHSSSLSIEHATKSKDIIQSAKFKALFPDIQLRIDKSAKGFYENTNKGARISTSTGSSIVGHHAHIIINDDPSDPKKSFSEADRDQVIEKIKELSRRKINAENTITLTIMQRLHEEDASGYILDNSKNLRHICLPAEVSDKIKPPELSQNYKDGLLDPIRQSITVLEEARIDLGSAKYAGQYDQWPTPKGGNIIKEAWFKTMDYQTFMTMRGTTPIIFFGDTAYTEKKKNDPSGFIATCRIDNNMYILNATSVRKEFPDLIRFLPGYLARYFYGPGSSLRIEPKASGKSVVQELADKTALNVTETPTPLGDKEERCNLSAPTVEARRVILVEGEWNDEFIDQVCGFPARKHDEYVDLLYYAIDYHFNRGTYSSKEAYTKAVRLLG